MHNLAKEMQEIQQIQKVQPGLACGRIVAGDAQWFIVQGECGLIRATAAVSCLVQPQVGDTVLAANDGDKAYFILGILKREQNAAAPTRLVFNGQVDLQVNGGGFNLAADTELTLAAHQKMALASESISMHAQRGDAVIDHVSLTSRVFNGRIKRIKVVAKSVENTFRRLTQRLQDAFRFVSDHEEIQTGSTRYLVEETLTMNAKNAVHMAEEIVTINAEQVHLG